MSDADDARRSANDDLDGKSSVPAWKLLQEAKRAPHPSQHVRKIPSGSMRSRSSMTDEIDPSLPPAFKAMYKANQRKRVDDFNSLDSVHSSKSYRSNMTQTPTTKNDSDSYDDDSSDCSFDGHDSFASLGEDDDEDDEAYRESKNMLAKQELEGNKPSSSSSIRSRLKKANMNTLDLIAE
mmetsp:Transcript_26388/g.73781  ORF Transcript_26388/g.73781 Transcript_26388/m.73781 type:complete len:180 (+) Transcript_26388:1198-1737(+)